MRGKYKNSREARHKRQQERQEQVLKEFELKNKQNEQKIGKKVTSHKKPIQTLEGVESKTPNKTSKLVELLSHLPKDATSRFILAFSLLLVLSAFLYLTDLVVNKKDYEGYTFHADQNLNFTVEIPSKWMVGLPDEESVKEIIKETTSGLTFDTRYSSLTTEIAPLSLIQQDPSGNYPYKRLMVISMFGEDSTIEYMNDHAKMEEEFKAILQELGHEGIRIEKVEDAYDGKLSGVVLYAKAFFEGKKMYYVHYTENLDKNILRVLYGSSSEIKNTKEIEEVLSTLTFPETNILEQLMQQGLDTSGTDGTESSEDTGGTEDTTGHDHLEEQSSEQQGGIVNQLPDGKIELDFNPNFDNEGDINSSEANE